MGVKLRRMQSTYGIPVAIVAILSFILSGCTGPKAWLQNGFKVGTKLLHPLRCDSRTLDRRGQSPAEES